MVALPRHGCSFSPQYRPTAAAGQPADETGENRRDAEERRTQRNKEGKRGIRDEKRSLSPAISYESRSSTFSVSSLRPLRLCGSPGFRLPDGCMMGLEGSGAGSEGGRVALWRRNLAAIWAAQMLAIVGFNTRAPFYVFFLRDDLGVHSTRALTLWSGALNSAGALTMMITAPIWGVVADRYGRKPMVVRAMACGFVLAVLSSFAQQPWHVLVLRLLEGRDARHRLRLRRLRRQFRPEGATGLQPRADPDGGLLRRVDRPVRRRLSLGRDRLPAHALGLRQPARPRRARRLHLRPRGFQAPAGDRGQTPLVPAPRRAPICTTNSCSC